MTLRHRKSDKAPFWGCSQYPDCTAIQSMTGRQSAGSPPVKKNQKQREAENQRLTEEIQHRATFQDGCECPFDDVPGPNDTYTAFGMIGSLEAIEAVCVGELDSEFRRIVG